MDTSALDTALLAWVKSCPLLRGRARLGYLGPRAGDVAVIASPESPDDGDAFIDGTRKRRADFALALTLPLSPDDDTVSQSSFRAVRAWMDWVTACPASGVYPALGPDLRPYDLTVKSAAPQVVRYDDNGLAKFQFFATLYYEEV